MLPKYQAKFMKKAPVRYILVKFFNIKEIKCSYKNLGIKSRISNKKVWHRFSSVTQSCPTLCDAMDCSSPGSSVHGILQQEYWSGLPFPSPGDLSNPRTEPGSPALQADYLSSEPPGQIKSSLSPPNKYSTLKQPPKAPDHLLFIEKYLYTLYFLFVCLDECEHSSISAAFSFQLVEREFQISSYCCLLLFSSPPPVSYFQWIFGIPGFGDLGYFNFFFHVLIDIRISFGAIFVL